MNLALVEIELMKIIQKEPMSPAELEKVLPVPPRRLKTVLQDLRHDGLVTRVKGTHLMALREL